MQKKIMCACLVTVLCLSGCVTSPDPVVSREPESYASWDPGILYSDYYYMIDLDSRQVLLDQGSEEQMYPASLTKMMTAILAIENIPDPENTIITITDEMLAGLVEADASTAGFIVGDEVTAMDCIYADMLPSGADGSRALAFYISGGEEGYVQLMNEKAQELGMNSTHFANITGLHDDRHYSTCRDMALLLEYCMQNSTFMKVMTTDHYATEPILGYYKGLGMDNAVLKYINQEEPYYKYSFLCEGFIGGKSGFTDEAEYTLASTARINGRNLLMVNAHAYKEPHYPASIEDAVITYDAFRNTFGWKEAVSEGSSWGSVKVRNTNQGSVEAVAEGSLSGDLPAEENVHYVVDLPASIDAQVEQGQVLGTLHVYVYDKELGSVQLLASEGREKNITGVIETAIAEHPWIPASMLVLACILLIMAVRALIIDRAR